MDSKRLEEIRARKEEIAAAVKDESKKINAEELRAELDALNKEQKEIEERAKIILDVNTDAAKTKKIDKPEVYNGTLVKTITRDFYNESGGCCRCFQ